MNGENPVKKRILFLVSSLYGGGAERIALLLCRYWSDKGHEVTLMPTFSGRGGSVYVVDSRVNLIFLADRVESRRKTPLSMLRRLSALRRYIRETKPDVVVSFLVNVNVAALLATLGVAVRPIISERNYPPLVAPGCYRWLGRRIYHWSKVVVCPAGEIASWLNNHVPKVKTTVIPNPLVMPLPDVEPRLDPSEWVAGERRILLGVGRLANQKGFDLLLPAFASIAGEFPEWDLVIMGEGPLRHSLTAQRDALGLASRAHLPGFAGNIADWYKRADLYVCSSRHEGFGNMITEAMAHGVPAVSYDCDAGPRDIIRADVDGLLVPPGEGVPGLANALARLMGNEALRKQMGVKAREVVDRFSMEKIGRLWDDLL